MIGLGLALAQPKRRVLVITGDGEMLMGLGSLATIGVQQPANLTVVVIDNERYGETGMQGTHTAHGVDLNGVARACGFNVVDFKEPANSDPQGQRSALRRGQGRRGKDSAGAAAARGHAAQGALPARLARAQSGRRIKNQGQTTFFPVRKTWSVPDFFLADVFSKELQRALARLLG